MEGSLSAYLVSVNTQNGSSRVARVNNDPFGASKDHIRMVRFTYASTMTAGSGKHPGTLPGRQVDR